MTFIPCSSCKNWTDEFRYKNLCKSCNNGKLIIDPKERLCNRCGECLCPLGTINNDVPHGLVDARVTGGFDSYHLIDCTSYIFSICEKCLRELFIEFKIKPTIHETDVWSDNEELSAWEIDQQAYEFRIWKDTGGHHQAYLNRKCNYVKDCSNEAVYTILYSDHQYSDDCCCQDHSLKYDWIKTGPNPNNYRLVPFISDTLKAFV